MTSGGPTPRAETLAPAIGHPQFAMQALLNASASHVTRCASSSHRAGAREAVVSEAIRLADRPMSGATSRSALFRSTRRWPHVAVIASANPEEEALAIAVALRERTPPTARPPRW